MGVVVGKKGGGGEGLRTAIPLYFSGAVFNVVLMFLFFKSPISHQLLFSFNRRSKSTIGLEDIYCGNRKL